VDEYYEEGEEEKRWKVSKNTFKEEAIKVYSRAIKFNQIVIETKSKHIKRGQWFFLCSIISVALVLSITLAGIAAGIPLIESGILSYI
jgi:cbb3-type cytochrome oxidase subunit 1